MRPERLLGILVLMMFAGTARPGELVLEEHLSSFTEVPSATMRLDLGSEWYAGDEWHGARNVLRLERALGEGTAWSMSLPWIWSDAQDAGLGRRGNLRFGFMWKPPLLSRLRVCGESWLPFSDDRLAPLQMKRGLLRWTLRGGAAHASQRADLALSMIHELRGLVGGGTGLPLDAWYEGELRWTMTRSQRLRPMIFARGAFRDEVLWTEAGGGLALHWDEGWRLECSAGAYSADLDEPFPRLRLRMGLRRDFADPVAPPEEEGGPADMARDAAAGHGDETVPGVPGTDPGAP